MQLGRALQITTITNRGGSLPRITIEYEEDIMKKIINGKRYDTETAKLIGSDGYSNPSDFNYWSEDLYQKKTGEFFLYGVQTLRCVVALGRGKLALEVFVVVHIVGETHIDRH